MTGNQLLTALSAYLKDPERARRQLAWLNAWIVGDNPALPREIADVTRYFVDTIDRAVAIKDRGSIEPGNLKEQKDLGTKDLQNAYRPIAPGEPGD